MFVYLEKAIICQVWHMIYGKCDYRMAIKVVFPLCSSFFTLLLYNLDQVETCFAKYTNYNTFSPIKVIYFFNT